MTPTDNTATRYRMSVATLSQLQMTCTAMALGDNAAGGMSHVITSWRGRLLRISGVPKQPYQDNSSQAGT